MFLGGLSGWGGLKLRVDRVSVGGFDRIGFLEGIVLFKKCFSYWFFVYDDLGEIFKGLL